MSRKKVYLVCKSKAMENLGVMYLSAIIKEGGHFCKILSLPQAEKDYKMLRKADFVGMSIMTGDMTKFRSLGWMLKETMRPPVIAVGGPDPTFFPEGYGWADHVVKGEAEAWVAEYFGVKIVMDKLDHIPWPDRTDFPRMKIRDFISSRGCPFNCAYCYNDRWFKMFQGPRVRYRDPGDVVAEIEDANPKFAYFQDSCFGVSMKWLRSFSEQYRYSVNIPYHCHLRPVQVNEERVVLLHESNCYSTRIALETGSDRLKRLIKRDRTTNQEVLDAAKLLKKWGIKLMIQNMLCLPTSRIEEDLETLEVNVRAQPNYAWSSIFVPYPGTELGDLCIFKGWYKGNYEDISDSFFDKSPLSFISAEYREQTYYLQKAFALCVAARYVPRPEELTAENFPMLVHKLMRKVGDAVLYGGVI
jgi:anaerobic magnesium-protoporphyrin IX monomethyl ester cyclase